MSHFNQRNLKNIKNLNLNGKFKEMEQLCRDLKEVDTISDEEKLYLDNFSLLALVKLRYSEEALKLTETIIKKSKLLKKPLEMIEALISKARVLINYRVAKETQTGREILVEVSELVKKLTNFPKEDRMLKLAKIHETEGMAFLYEEKMEESFKCFM
ncbi:MAG: hypothetical protein ACXAAM_02295, partial [Candidatus Heimdallarchaeaceae archaeon]